MFYQNFFRIHKIRAYSCAIGSVWLHTHTQLSFELNGKVTMPLLVCLAGTVFNVLTILI